MPIPWSTMHLPIITAYEKGDYRVVDSTADKDIAEAIYQDYINHGWETYKHEHEGITYIIVRTHINI